MLPLSIFQSDLERLIAAAGVRLRFNEPMALHTSFHVGGSADVFFEPENETEIRQAVGFCRQNGWPWTILGNGSNILVSDRGIRGLVLVIGEAFSGIEINGSVLTARAGTRLASLASFAAKNGLAGLEFASGIPGTLGGAILMNAGAYGCCMSDIIQKTDFLDTDLEKRQIEGAAHQFAYRQSIFSEQEGIILGAQLALRPDDSGTIMARMADLACRRRQSQPLDLPSAGSAFKRPPNHFAGKLISDCHLKGLQVGAAQVSEKHAGFIVNLGQATAVDIRTLIDKVRSVVAAETGVCLEPEIRFIGDWQNWPAEPPRCDSGSPAKEGKAWMSSS
ncbi:MAG: UDP-N-acetylmuramate dehydrogenase [Clostridiaceae bacterium]|nr:UDP-N-acetylmuramate dehydrogenase [Clostridiaceae bacterium]